MNSNDIQGYWELFTWDVTLLRLSNFVWTRCLWEKMRHQNWHWLRAITTSSQAPVTALHQEKQWPVVSVESGPVQSTGSHAFWTGFCRLEDVGVGGVIVVSYCYEKYWRKTLAKQYRATSSHQARSLQHPSVWSEEFIYKGFCLAELNSQHGE